jgi:hypothetical protein
MHTTSLWVSNVYYMWIASAPGILYVLPIFVFMKRINVSIILSAMSLLEQQLREKYHKHASGAFPLTSLDSYRNDSQYMSWVARVEDHLYAHTLPLLHGRQEYLVDVFLTHMRWTQSLIKGVDMRTPNMDITSRPIYGTGYVCVTNHNIHIASLSDLARKYPPPRSSLASRYLEDFLRIFFDLRVGYRRLRRNLYWDISLDSLRSIRLIEDYEDPIIVFASNHTIWNLYGVEHYPAKLNELMLAIKMARSGKLPKLEDSQTTQIGPRT